MERYGLEEKKAWFRKVADQSLNAQDQAGNAQAVAAMEMAWQMKILNAKLDESHKDMKLLIKAIKTIGR